MELTTHELRQLAKTARQRATRDNCTYFVTSYRNGHEFVAEVISESAWFSQPNRDEESVIYMYNTGYRNGIWN